MKRMIIGVFCVLAVSGLGAGGMLKAAELGGLEGEQHVIGVTGMT
ncbi:MAG: hypothetical protein V3W41_05905 [Planctomycetota bacterium]